MTTTRSVHRRSRSLAYRAAIFAFGVTAYALGVGALVALTSIVLGVLPFTGGPLGRLSLGAALALDLCLLVVFALQHSVMARASFKARWTRIVPVAAERSAYLLATALALLPLLLLWQPMPAVVWSVEAPALRWLLVGVALGGWAYLLAASFAINHFELFGLQQVYQALRDRPLTQSPFRVRWMYRFDRHPIMTGILIGLWVTPTMAVDPSAVRDRHDGLRVRRRILRGALAAAPVGPTLRRILRARPIDRANLRASSRRPSTQLSWGGNAGRREAATGRATPALSVCAAGPRRHSPNGPHPIQATRRPVCAHATLAKAS